LAEIILKIREEIGIMVEAEAISRSLLLEKAWRRLRLSWSGRARKSFPYPGSFMWR